MKDFGYPDQVVLFSAIINYLTPIIETSPQLVMARLSMAAKNVLGELMDLRELKTMSKERERENVISIIKQFLQISKTPPIYQRRILSDVGMIFDRWYDTKRESPPKEGPGIDIDKLANNECFEATEQFTSSELNDYFDCESEEFVIQEGPEETTPLQDEMKSFLQEDYGVDKEFEDFLSDFSDKK